MRNSERASGELLIALSLVIVAVFPVTSPADVPAPRPIKTEMKIGSYYFPGFFNAARWTPMKAHGSPVPLLGYYRDGAPDVSDWHIKWALENGISYFVFDWYYDHRNGRVAEHNAALEQGFLKAKYREKMEFAVMWCNEESLDDPPYTVEQMITLGRNLGRYFKQSNYLRIEGRPVVFICRPQRMTKCFNAGFRNILSQISRAAGLDPGTDVYFVGLASDPEPVYAEMGFAALTAYNYAGTRTSSAGSRLRITYDDMVETYERTWTKMTAPGSLPYIVPVSPGWDSRPWYGPQALVHTDSTPEKFRRMCERAKRYANPKLRMVISECWDEFGEGSYIEPCEGVGFGYLHALRDAYGAGAPYPRDVVPTTEEHQRFTFRTIPPDSGAEPFAQQQGNLIADPDMEEGTGWVDFGGAPSRFVNHSPHKGEQCMEVRTGEGSKSILPTRVVFQRTYEFRAWVKGSPGTHARVLSALFDRQGKWTGSYHPIGESDSTEWTEVKRTVKVSDPGIGAMDLEFAADKGTLWVDDASIAAVAPEPPPRIVFEDDCTAAEGWVTYDEKPVSTQLVDEDHKSTLAVPAGTGVKTRKRIEVSPNTVLSIRVRFRCDPPATAVIQSAAYDERGEWIRGCYLAGGAFSWQDWTEASYELRVPKDSKAKYVDVECYAEGGQVLLGGARVVLGSVLQQR